MDHCVAHTGTVIGGWLLRLGLAQPDDVVGGLRRQDQERRRGMLPETAAQQTRA